MENFQVDYNLYRDLCYKLLDQIKSNGKKYKAVLCPLRGGFFLSYFMGRHLDVPVVYIEISSYRGNKRGEFHIGFKSELEDGNYLLCDDIYDSGNTIKKIHSLYPHVNFDTTCLISKIKEADIYSGLLLEEETWVDFFWEVM